MAPAAQRRDHGLLLRGGNPAEYLVVLQDVRHEFGIFRQVAGIVAVSGVQAHVAGDCRHGPRIVTGDNAEVDALFPEVGEGRCGVGPNLFAECQYRGRHQHGRQGCLLGFPDCHGLSGMGQNQGPEAGRCQPGRGGQGLDVSRGRGLEDEFRRAQHPGAGRGPVGEADGAPFPGRREGDGGYRAGDAVVLVDGGEAAGCGVCIGVGPEPAQRLLPPLRR
ncbi:hypothetical protein D9M72_441430 [compost metagenome]